MSSSRVQNFHQGVVFIHDALEQEFQGSLRYLGNELTWRFPLILGMTYSCLHDCSGSQFPVALHSWLMHHHPRAGGTHLVYQVTQCVNLQRKYCMAPYMEIILVSYRKYLSSK